MEPLPAVEQREGRVDREGRCSQGEVQVQVFIGSKEKELAKGVEDDDESAGDAEVELELGRLTAEERRRAMIDLRP